MLAILDLLDAVINWEAVMEGRSRRSTKRSRRRLNRARRVRGNEFTWEHADRF